jgi:hypothetical protein
VTTPFLTLTASGFDLEVALQHRRRITANEIVVFSRRRRC